MKKSIMTVIGFGPMGQRFTKLFASNYKVNVYSSRNVKDDVRILGGEIATDLRQSVKTSDYVFFAVPILALPELVNRINSFETKEDLVVLDCCSARVAAEKHLTNLIERIPRGLPRGF